MQVSLRLAISRHRRRPRRTGRAVPVAAVLVAALLAAVLASPPPAGAVVACSSTPPATMEPTNLWPRRGPSFTVFANPLEAPPSVPSDVMEAALQQAIAEWNDDPASAIAITYGGLTTDARGFQNDGQDVVFWRDMDVSTVGATSVYGGPFGVVAGFDTALNRDVLYGADVGGFDLTTTLRHELGHAIGLCHDSAPEELMYPTQGRGAAGVRGLTPRALTEVATQYPNQELTTIVDEGRGLPSVVRTQRNALFVRSHNPITDTWGPEESLGPTAPPDGVRFVGRAAVGRDPKGRLELFVAGSDGTLYHSWQLTPEGGYVAWTPQLTGVQAGAAIVRNRDGRLEVFAVGTDQVVRTTWQAEPGGDWVEPLAVPGVDVRPSGLAAGLTADGRVELLALDAGGALWHRWQIDAGRGPWSDWAAIADAPAARSVATATDVAGTFHLWAIGEDGQVRESARPRDVTSATWAGTGPEAMTTGMATLVQRTPNGEPVIEVFATGPDGQTTWQRRQTSHDAWTPWEPMPPL